MKIASTTGVLATGSCMPLQTREISVRVETGDEFNTLSLADNHMGVMIEIVVNPEVKRLLKQISR